MTVPLLPSFWHQGGATLRKIGIAGLQLDLDKGPNLDRIAGEVRAAKSRLPWLDMVVLSELAAYGPSTQFAEPEDGPAERFFRDLARETNIWLVPGSLFTRVGGNIFNTTPVIAPSGEIVARYNKMFPFVPYEQGVTGGNSFCTFDVPGAGRFGLSICYDIWFGETTRTLVWQGAEILINPSLTNTIDRDVELAIARAAAATNQCYVFNVNGAGRQGFGRSIVCGPGGEVLHQAGSGREIMAFEIDLDAVTQVRERGWNGLGQPLKSFRDSETVFPPYARGARSPTLDALGPLAVPKSHLKI
jgi:deaminated glutathione amidase